MKKLEKKDTVIWYIAHNAENVFHFGKLEAGLELQTGQPILEEFETVVSPLENFIVILRNNSISKLNFDDCVPSW